MTQTTLIQLSEPVNLRDLGGVHVDGGQIIPGFAIRSDDLSTIPARTATQLVESGLSTVIDLRSRGEVQATGRGPLIDHTVMYHHVPFMADISNNQSFKMEPGKMPSMADFYQLCSLRRSTDRDSTGHHGPAPGCRGSTVLPDVTAPAFWLPSLLARAGRSTMSRSLPTTADTSARRPPSWSCTARICTRS